MSNPINRLFIEHPASVGESYFQHLMMASRFASRMVLGGIACFLHGVFPFLWSKTGSGIISELHGSMLTHRAKGSAQHECTDQLHGNKEVGS